MTASHTIAVVDDDAEQRELAIKALRRALETLAHELRVGWQVREFAPLTNIADFGSWVDREGVRVLLIDEKLNERLPQSVSYLGHQVVQFLAPREYALPIYFLTAVPDDTGTQAVRTRVRGVIARKELDDAARASSWLAELVHEGQRYVDRDTLMHERLSEIAGLAVAGTATEKDLQEASSIRVQLGLVLESDNATVERQIQSRSTLLTRLEEILDDLESTLPEASPVAKTAPAVRKGRAPRRTK